MGWDHTQMEHFSIQVKTIFETVITIFQNRNNVLGNLMS